MATHRCHAPSARISGGAFRPASPNARRNSLRSSIALDPRTDLPSADGISTLRVHYFSPNTTTRGAEPLSAALSLLGSGCADRLHYGRRQRRQVFGRLGRNDDALACLDSL